MRSTRDPLERFREKVSAGPGDCLTWTGARDPGGYGTFWLDGRMEIAHRAALKLAEITVPPGLEVDHLCKNRACVNTDHLDLVTHAENNRRGDSPSAVAARQTVCQRGHTFDAANTYIDPKGKRNCRACSRLRREAP